MLPFAKTPALRKNSIRPNRRRVLTVKSGLVLSIGGGSQSPENEGRLNFDEGQGLV
jgi:hypothetical protein